MDLNGDGVLATPPSLERAVTAGEEVVFEVSRKYLSIHRMDIAARKFTLRSHLKADYLRVDLEVGVVFPDFEFADFEGKKHHLSNIRASYVLLDFWGSWCGPCLRELPTLKRAYDEFRARGFQILGIDAKEPAAKAYECITANRLPWLQATAESTTELVEKKLNISAYPTLILLDHAKRIVSFGPKLRGDELIRTLDKLLPDVRSPRDNISSTS
jgi:thiol-disulfide isomerase/thioredoxin